VSTRKHRLRRYAGAAALSIVAVALAAQDALLQKRLTQSEIDSLAKVTAGAGTSGLPAVTTTVLFGDPAKAGLYSIQLQVAPNTVIRSHTHRDTRTATVVSGSWYFGYGPKNEPGALKLLTAGSFYTEPAGEAHFARTDSAGAVVVITGYGPSDTAYVE
jgi:quercetin dioxygenase-like cupin family protein